MFPKTYSAWQVLLFQPGFQRQSSYDRVRKIVQEEGRTARNLIQFNVPVEDEETHTPSKWWESFQVTLDISGSPIDFQWGSRKYPG